jgi:hypothetical protein
VSPGCCIFSFPFCDGVATRNVRRFTSRPCHAARGSSFLFELGTRNRCELHHVSAPCSVICAKYDAELPGHFTFAATTARLRQGWTNALQASQNDDSVLFRPDMEHCAMESTASAAIISGFWLGGTV